MIGNPEFRRNLWLELTPQRLIAAPIIAAIAAVALWQVEVMPTDMRRLFPVMAFVLLTAMWGSRHAADAVAEEISAGTWDFQRMSALGAWSMSWGKLLGATIFDWYCGLFCLAIFIAASIANAASDVALQVVVLVASGLLVHAMAMFGTLIHRWRRPDKRRIRAMWGQGLSFVALLFLLPFAWPNADYYKPEGYQWYGVNLDSKELLLLTLAVAVCWLSIGIYRLMRVELQYRNLPWVWPAFLLFVTFYAGGFPSQLEFDSLGYVWLVILVVVSTGATYLAMLAEPKNTVRYRWFVDELKHRAWNRALVLTPLWLLSFGLAVVAGAASAIIVSPIHPASRELFENGAEFATWPLIIAGIMFMTRDMAIMLFLNFGKQGRRGDVAATAYLFVCYSLLGSIVIAAKADFLFNFVMPFPRDNSMIVIFPPLAEAAIAAWLAWRRLMAQSAPAAMTPLSVAG
ncbi:MAG: hypothetical protein ACREEE_00585 [Dongiaceae bacterium]